MQVPPAALGLLVSAVLSAVLAVESQAATFEGVGDLPGGTYWSSVADLSADGTTAVGSSFSASGREAYRRRAGIAIEGLGDLTGGDFSSQAAAVSADGATVVGAATAGAVVWDSAFRWTEASGMEDIPDPSGSVIPRYATAVSADGSTIAGSEGIPFPCPGCGCCSPWGAWINEDEVQTWHIQYADVEPYGKIIGPEALAISADGSVWGGVVSLELTEPPWEMPGPALWTTGGTVLTQLIVAPDARVNAISADGSTLVGELGSEAFVFTAAGGVVLLGDLPGGVVWSSAADVSADGSIVVGGSDAASGLEPFVWDATNGMRNLSQLLACRGADLAGWDLFGAAAISDDAFTVAGSATNPAGDREGWTATINGIGEPCEPKAIPTTSPLGTIVVIGLLLVLGVRGGRAACREDRISGHQISGR